MTNGMKRHMSDRDMERIQKMNRKHYRKVRMIRIARKITFPIHRLAKPQRVAWVKGWRGRYPSCPRCGEYAYHVNMCCFCGQRFLDGQTIGQVLEKYER